MPWTKALSCKMKCQFATNIYMSLLLCILITIFSHVIQHVWYNTFFNLNAPILHRERRMMTNRKLYSILCHPNTPLNTDNQQDHCFCFSTVALKIVVYLPSIECKFYVPQCDFEKILKFRHRSVLWNQLSTQ